MPLPSSLSSPEASWLRISACDNQIGPPAVGNQGLEQEGRSCLVAR